MSWMSPGLSEDPVLFTCSENHTTSLHAHTHTHYTHPYSELAYTCSQRKPPALAIYRTQEHVRANLCTGPSLAKPT